MAEKIIPKTGQKIIISEKLKNGGTRDYISQVLEIVDEKNYRIAVPISKGLLVTIMNGTVISVVYALENAGMFRFEAKIINKTKSGNVPSMNIERMGEIIKDQRRNHFRIPLVIATKIRRAAELESINSYSKDLSGGGMRFISDEEMREGELIVMDFALEKLKFSIKGKIIRKFKTNEPRKFEAAAEFFDISESDRNEIISYLFHKQRLMIKMR